MADTDGTFKKIFNSVSFCVGNVQESQDLGARTPIGVIGIENFKFENHELIRKSLKPDTCNMGHYEVQTEVCSLQCQTKPLKTEVLKSGIKKIYQPELMISDCAKMY